MDRTRETHWQDAWATERLSEARREPGREKFYAIVAYPGSSGFLHLGHLRGLTSADALHRYHRMRGRSVFFPTGTHASGLPAVTFAQKVASRDPLTVRQLEDNRVPESEWPGLEDPARAARFLGTSYLGVYRRLGILVDERAYVTTIDDDYGAFIRWQFHRLERAGALVQAPHFASVCPVCGPVSVDPSETDLSSGGDAEWITYTTVPFRLEDGRILLCATLRPETVYGVTNIWVHPSDPLVVWHHGESEYVVGRLAARRLAEQVGGRVGHEVDPRTLIRRNAVAPFTDRVVPVLASPLVDPAIGTGVVMSVPSHAPADWLAVQALHDADRALVGSPPTIIELAGVGTLTASERELQAGDGPPAERAVRATGARSLDDADELEEATERLYRLELVRGRMRPDLLDGASVADARNAVRARLLDGKLGFELQEFSTPVVCRNGHEVTIRRVPDQWFIHYADPAWKERTRAMVARMTIAPQEYARELPAVLDWFGDRACVRRGRWLGTPFPLDPTWIIEPIADSTFYPAYFVVRPFVTSGRIDLADLTDAFFDHVFLGEGEGEPSVDPTVQREVREAFTYWYPLDVNIGGKEHQRVHFPVFLATHALLLPPELHPKGLFVHWWLTHEGGRKISKKHVAGKGGAIPPIFDACERWGADAIRLFYASAASSFQDIEWAPELADRAQERLEDIERLVGAAGIDGSASPELEAWLASEMHELLERVEAAFTRFELRDVAEEVYARVPALLRRFTVRGGEGGEMVRRVIDAWIRLMVPITPHLAEELGAPRFRGLAAIQPFPTSKEFDRSESAIGRERFLETVEDDLREVLRPALARGEAPEGVTFFVAEPWKREVEGWVREAFDAGARGVPLREVMDRVALHPEVAAHRALVPRYVQRVAPLLRGEPRAHVPAVDEIATLRASEGYLARRFRFRLVEAYPEALAEAHDPLGRRDRARPGRPAFYLTGRRPADGSGPKATES
ncbi:MAG: class I tRNA ligase family protein [Thermoplasmata archaeon]